MQPYSRLVALSVAIATVPLISGCMTAIYASGEVSSLLQGQYRQDATFETELAIDGVVHRVRAPIACRSFVHPVGGMRVTRTVGELFEFSLKNEDKAYLRVQYSCLEKDATIQNSDGALLSVYRVVKTPSIHVIRDWAIPETEAVSKSAPVVLLASRVDRRADGINGRPVLSIRAALRDSGIVSSTPEFVSLHSWDIPIHSKIVDVADAAILQSMSAPQLVPSVVSRRIVDNYFKSGVHFVRAHTKDIPLVAGEIPFRFSYESRTFEPGESQVGRRIYYALPSTDGCTTVACRLKTTKIRIGTLMLANEGFLMIYEPEKKVVYWRQYDFL